MFSNIRYPTLGGDAARLRRVPVAVQRALGPRAGGASRTTRGTTRPASRCPPALVEKIRKSKTFNQGYATTEYLAAALLDLAWHTLPGRRAAGQDVDAFEKAALEAVPASTCPQVPPRYHTTYFAHIWERRLLGGLLRVPLERGARRRRLLLVPGARRHDARERPALPRHDPLPRKARRTSPMLYRAFRGRDPDRRAAARGARPWRRRRPRRRAARRTS